ncbi:SDR family NAD(P)-dependent oxidoreductase [Streptomyces sp. NBC_00038]|uniref:SDR family NAD(P)-dependent oxidoreductase n=1 Tax=Streptomyces sp. NBC_00038 TaxID=2903615 RepID=UPI002252143C|nr:SDR family NAD(P)-dependent oxidoreductase [Streptomyces sp. NBC_00038]MCX5557199.1 SDR family NAD(P)-dependent oxidoreductase [Streptomyces sp. NBC_00038]
MAELDLKGTVTVVTGASSGIGAAVARVLAARGSAVALVARREDRLAALAAELTAAGGRALSVPADVTDAEQARAAVECAVEAWGRLDILVNNAGVPQRGPLMDSSPAEFDRVVGVNLLGNMYCAHAALPHLVEAAAGEPRRVADLVNVSSVAGRVVHKTTGVYNASKYGLNAYTEALRQEVAGRRVRVSVLEPSAVETELFPPRVRQELASRIGTYERLSAMDVADAVEYVVTRPAHAAVSELLIRPSESER